MMGNQLLGKDQPSTKCSVIVLHVNLKPLYTVSVNLSIAILLMSQFTTCRLAIQQDIHVHTARVSD